MAQARRRAKVTQHNLAPIPSLVPTPAPAGVRDLTADDFPVELKQCYVAALKGNVYLSMTAGPVMEFISTSPDGKDMVALGTLVSQVVMDKSGKPIFADGGFGNTHLKAYLEIAKAVAKEVNLMLGDIGSPNA